MVENINDHKEIFDNESPSEYEKHCILCKSSVEYQRIFKGYEKDNQFYEVYVCPECRLGITLPFPDKEQLNRLYSTGSYREHQSRFINPVEKLIRFFRKSRQKQIEAIIPQGRILDMGCARGVFLSIMRERGWETFGLELNDETASYARNELGLDVKAGRLVDAQFENESFDVITIWHVFEHLPEPRLIIEECSRILKPGGLLVIALPNFDSLQAKISGRHWFHLDVPYHLYHFTLKNLSLLLKKSSFKIIKVKRFSFEFNPFGYLQSFFNMTRIENNLLYNILKSRTIRKSVIVQPLKGQISVDKTIIAEKE
ncbi:MAG TPA: class I SAM-dependent methyltransferase [Nitrospirae bacterium]|nr:putative S-adenosylmethionine-dependent methyltransferase/MSMEI_2290 [bacterium BMS3Abin06]HDH12417.1 class I SAM-dependent methyltransferase [Nitrospirota bacterium]HDY99837.1 class I SAM-dependent methyltransferase [Nitrospirota bacterium]